MANLKTKLSAAMLALIAAGASAPVLMDQFLNEKEGNSLTSYRDGAGIWTICRGATRVDGRPVTQGMKLTQAKCDQVNAVERNKALAWVDQNVRVHLTPPQKVGIASFAPITSGPVSAFLPLSTASLMPVTVKAPALKFAGGFLMAEKIAACVPTIVTARSLAVIRKAHWHVGG